MAAGGFAAQLGDEVGALDGIQHTATAASLVWSVSVRGKVGMIYEVGVITPVRESNGGRTLHGFNVIGVNGRPLVTFNYETEEEAAAAREQMREAVAGAKAIIPHTA